MEKLLIESCGAVAEQSPVWILRRHSPKAEHLFLINPTNEIQAVNLDSTQLEDAINGEILSDSRVQVAANGARWLRQEKL